MKHIFLRLRTGVRSEQNPEKWGNFQALDNDKGKRTHTQQRLGYLTWQWGLIMGVRSGGCLQVAKEYPCERRMSRGSPCPQEVGKGSRGTFVLIEALERLRYSAHWDILQCLQEVFPSFPHSPSSHCIFYFKAPHCLHPPRLLPPAVENAADTVASSPQFEPWSFAALSSS